MESRGEIVWMVSRPLMDLELQRFLMEVRSSKTVYQGELSREQQILVISVRLADFIFTSGKILNIQTT